MKTLLSSFFLILFLFLGASFAAELPDMTVLSLSRERVKLDKPELLRQMNAQFEAQLRYVNLGGATNEDLEKLSVDYHDLNSQFSEPIDILEIKSMDNKKALFLVEVAISSAAQEGGSATLKSEKRSIRFYHHAGVKGPCPGTNDATCFGESPEDNSFWELVEITAA